MSHQRVFYRHIVLILFFILNLSKLSYSNDDKETETKIKSINEYLISSEKYKLSAPRKSLKFALESIQLSKQIKHTDFLKKAYSQVLYAHYMLYNMDSIILYADTLLSLPDIEVSLSAKTYFLLSIAHRSNGQYNQAISFAEKAIQEYSSINDRAGVMNVTLSLANIYQEKGNNDKSMPYYFQVLEYTKQIQDTVFQAQVIGAIANVYMDTGEKQRGLQYLLQGVELLKSHDNGHEYATALNNYGTGLKEMKKYDSALIFFSKALTIYKNIGNKDAIAVALQNIGSTQISQKKYKQGMKNLYKAMKMFESLKSDRELVNIYYDIGTAYENIGQVDSTIFYLKSSINLAERLGSPYEKRESLFTLYEFYKKNNEYSKALNYYTKYIQLRDSISNLKMKQSFQELEVKYQTAQKELDIQKLKDQQIIDQSRKRVLIILFFAVVLLALMGIIFLLMKRRKDREILTQKLLVFQKEKDLSQAELAEKEATEKQIKKELEFKTKQLASHALIMMQKNTFYQELSENIHSHMQLIDGKGKLALIQIQKKLEQSFNIEKDWDLFRLYFEQTNENFFENLKKINPKLTSHDYRLAALINLNLNIKEAAAVLNISPDSLKNGRYRLKRKLNIPKEISLPEFLRTL